MKISNPLLKIVIAMIVSCFSVYLSAQTWQELLSAHEHTLIPKQRARIETEIENAIAKFTEALKQQNDFLTDEQLEMVRQSLRGLAQPKQTKYSLRLENLGIRVLPALISEFTNANNLMLRGNDLRALPNEIANLVDLQFIDISNNPRLLRLPGNILDLQKLNGIENANTSIEIFFSDQASRQNNDYLTRDKIEKYLSKLNALQQKHLLISP